MRSMEESMNRMDNGMKSARRTLPGFGKTKFDALLCAIDQNVFNKVSDEMKRERIVDRTARGESIASDKPTFYDASLSGIMQLLRNEAKSGGPSGAFYAEHLAHVLARMPATPLKVSDSRIHGLRDSSLLGNRLL
jgi:hypothetical protein